MPVHSLDRLPDTAGDSSGTPGPGVLPPGAPAAFTPDGGAVPRLLGIETLAGLGTWTWDVATDHTTWSPNLCRMLGTENGPVELTLARFLEGVHPEDRARVEATISAALRGEAPYEFETRVHRDDGALLWAYVHAHVERGADGTPARVSGIVQDVTAHKRAQDALRESEESYRTIFRNASDAIWLHDLDTGAMLDVNRAGAEMYGYTVDEMMCAGHDALLYPGSPYTAERVAEYLARAAAGETPRFEWMGRHRDGSAVWGELTLSRVTIGGKDRILASGRDITERVRAEEARRQAEEDARSMAGRMRAVAGAAAGVIGAECVDTLLPVLRDACAQVISFDAFWLSFYTEADHTLTYAGFDSGMTIAPQTVAAAGTPSERVIRRRRSVVTGRATDPEASGGILMGRPQRSESIIRTPILGGERVLGILSVQSYTPDLYTERDVEVLEAVASLAATALLNLELLAERTAAEEALRRINEELEQRVAERTAELADANTALEAEVADHEAASTELRQRTDELEGIFQALPDLYFRLAADGTILEHRSGADERLYLPPDEFLGRRLPDVLPPDAAARVADGLDEVRRTGRLVCVEYALTVGDCACEYEARLLPLGDGSLISIVRDITDRRRAERELQEREEHFRRLTENASDVVQVIDREGQVLYTGPSVEHMLGHTPDELVGQHAADLVHPQDLAAVAQAIETVAENPGRPLTVRYRLRHKDGRWRVFEASGRTLAPDSADEGIVVNARDITERQVIEEAMRQSEEHFRRLIENSGDMVQLLDATGRITYTGPSVQRLLGWMPDELEGTDALGYIHPDDLARTRSALGEMLAHPEEARLAEYRVRHRDGHYRQFEASARSLFADDGSQVVVVNARDVTERRLAEDALAHAKEEAERAREAAERANRAKSEFLSRMSHELRTPMNSILGFAQLLDRAALAPEHRKGVGHILKAGRHLLQLINEVLEIARIEAGRHNLSLEPVRVGTVLQEVVGLVRPLAAQCRVELDEAPWAGGNRYVHADRQRLAQVLLNLLGNAIKYNHPEGRVHVTCEPARSADGARRLVVRVHDTGPGIPEGKVDELFTPFSRLGAEQSRVEGTGLGLALSQRLADAMGAVLVLEHTGPGGSVFRLDLQEVDDPLERLEEAGDPAARGDDVEHAPARLLYIEDNLANLSLVETILLSRPGWRTLPALQGRIGLELAREHLPDLILLDLHLPDLPGEQVLRRLREDARTASIPVVIITADATRDTLERMRAAGADAHLTKPLDIDEFMATLERFLPTPRQPRP